MARNVGQSCQTVGVQGAITHLQHIVLDSPAQREWVKDVEMLEQARHVGMLARAARQLVCRERSRMFSILY